MTVTVQNVDACYLDAQPFEYRGYSVQWRGWIAAQSTNRIVGQWVGYPTSQMATAGESKATWRERWPFLVVIVNGRTQGSYAIGAVWDVRPPEGQPWITERDFESTAGLIRTTTLRIEAKQSLLEMIDDLHLGRMPLPVPPVETVYRDPVTKEEIAG